MNNDDSSSLNGHWIFDNVLYRSHLGLAIPQQVSGALVREGDYSSI
jgi:hypothetical protein